MQFFGPHLRRIKSVVSVWCRWFWDCLQFENHWVWAGLWGRTTEVLKCQLSRSCPELGWEKPQFRKMAHKTYATHPLTQTPRCPLYNVWTPAKLCFWTACHASTGCISRLLPLADTRDGYKKTSIQRLSLKCCKRRILIQSYKTLSLNLMENTVARNSLAKAF